MLPEEACTTYRSELDLFALAELEPGRMVSVRDHVGQCEDCQQEVSFWQEIEQAARDHVRVLQQEITPEEEALETLLSEIASLPEIDTGAGVEPPAAAEPALETPPESQLKTPLVRGLRRRGVVLAIAATVLLALGLAIPWSIQRWSRERPALLVNGREVVVTDRQPLQAFDGMELASLHERVRVRLDNLEVRLGPQARLRLSDSTPPRRVLSPAEGEVALREEAGTTLVRIGDLELTLEPGDEVSIQVDEATDGAPGTRVSIRVWEGRIELRASTGESRAPPIEIAAGEGVEVQLDGAPEEPGTHATQGFLEPLDGTPIPLELPAEPSDTPAGDTGAEPPPAVPPDTDVAGEEGDDPGTEPVAEPSPTALEELPAGVVRVLVPEDPLAPGDLVVMEVSCGTGDAPLGAYSLEIGFAPGASDLRVMLVRPPESVPTGGQPFHHTFDPETQVLRVADTTGSLSGMGRGTFTLLRIEVAIISGAPGRKQIGGSLEEFIDAVEGRAIGSPTMQTRGSIRIRE